MALKARSSSFDQPLVKQLTKSVPVSYRFIVHTDARPDSGTYAQVDLSRKFVRSNNYVSSGLSASVRNRS
jgi:hypothetical protein